MTGFEQYPQAQLHALFSADTWDTLELAAKTRACQEVADRYAAQYGHAPCRVTHRSMEGAVYGYQSGSEIVLNSSLLAQGVFTTRYRDDRDNLRLVRTAVPAPGWQILDTVYHEGTHGLQRAQGRMPNTYIKPETEDSLYRIQGVEKEAFALGRSKTLQAISEAEAYIGARDASRDAYIECIRTDSFQGALQDAVLRYDDPSIEQTLQEVIADRDLGILPAESSKSYQSLRALCDGQDLSPTLSGEQEYGYEIS